MKKFIIIALVILGISSLTTSDAIKIPSEAIRFRVIANSNSIIDQNIKTQIKDKLENNIYNTLKEVDNINEARDILAANIPSINTTVNDILVSNNFKYGYKVNLGMNYFPEKEYKGVTYEEGNYESLVVTLGAGAGDNWWCVLFPPLCLLEAEDNDTSDVEYQFFVKKLIDKFLK